MPSSSDADVIGAEGFNALSKALKAAGKTELRKELHKGLELGAKPLIPLTREEARSRLPSSGGLAKKTAKAPQRVRVRTGKDPGVKLTVGRNGGAARSTNKGYVKHPTYGNRDAFVKQEVPEAEGWFDNTVKDNLDEVKPELQKSLERTIEKIAGEANRG